MGLAVIWNDDSGWFGRRKVAAAGLMAQSPLMTAEFRIESAASFLRC